MSMTGVERIHNILQRKPVDRIGLFEHFWSDTHSAWSAQGHLTEGENMGDHFGFDMGLCWAFNMVADLDFGEELLAETDETKTFRNGNGAVFRTHKLHNATPEHIDFRVRDRRGWLETVKPLLTPDPRRINFTAYREARQHAAQTGRFFAWSGVNVFEIMKDVTGHLYMLEGMVTDPEWICDMADTYARLTVELQEILFAAEGYPDGIWYYEDMGFKQRPFMSPRMYRSMLQPAHTYTIGFAKSHGLPVIMHSCGYIEPLLGGMIEAGIDCLQVIEVKAGMDLLKLHRDWGDRISFMGGIDVRKLYSNDRSQIDAELEAKIPEVMRNFGYVLHSDHSIPNTVDYATYRYFIDKGLELGAYR